MDQLADLQEAWLHAVDALPDGQPPGAACARLRWMLEEYRVSLFAQQLGTAYPVSDQRIRKVLADATGRDLGWVGDRDRTPTTGR